MKMGEKMRKKVVLKISLKIMKTRPKMPKPEMAKLNRMCFTPTSK